MCTESRLGAESHQLQGGQRPLAELESSAFALKAMSTRVIRLPCLLVKPEFEELSNTTCREYKQTITERDNSLKDDKVK